MRLDGGRFVAELPRVESTCGCPERRGLAALEEWRPTTPARCRAVWYRTHVVVYMSLDTTLGLFSSTVRYEIHLLPHVTV